MTPTEFNECVDEYADNLFRYCNGLTGNGADADDLVQTAYQKLWENRKKLDKKVARSWLFKTAYRSMIDTYRKVRRERDYRNVQQEGVSEFSERVEQQDLIKRALVVLTEEQKNVLLLRDYEGYSYKELCDITGLSMSNIKIILFRSRKKLKEKLIEMDYKEC